MKGKLSAIILSAALLCGCTEPVPVREISSEIQSVFSEAPAVTEHSESTPPPRTADADSTVITASLPDEAEGVMTAPTGTEPVFSQTVGAALLTENNTAAPETGTVMIKQTESIFPDTSPSPVKNSYYALNYPVQSAVWISYLEYTDIMKGKSREEFTQNIENCLDNLLTIGTNTVYVQVRAFGDAYYESAYFPKGDRLDGDYDPLEIMITAAHDRGMSFHAWINPMRLMTKEQMTSLDSSCILKKWFDEKKNMFEFDGRMYLNPACTEARELICAGIKEITDNYRVDGVQIDDYFYPDTAYSLDDGEYSSSGTSLSREDWRRQQVSLMVSEMYRTVHNAGTGAVFGISPAGSPDASFINLFADVYTWCASDGYCDYICPQIYYGLEHGTSPFRKTAEQWCSMTKDSGIMTVIGIAAYKAGTSDSYAGSGCNEWINSHSVISSEMSLAAELGCGTALFRYGSLFAPEADRRAAVSEELINIGKMLQ